MEIFYIQQITSFFFKKSLGCSHASTVYLCAIDLYKAFYKVNLHALFIKLMNRNIPVELLSVIEVLCADCFTCVKWFDVSGLYLSKLILELDGAQFSLHIYLPCT